MVFLSSPSSDKVDASQLPRIFELWFIDSPLLLFLSLGCVWDAGRRHFRPQWSGLAHVSFWRFFTLCCELCESCPWIWQISSHIDIPIILNTAFLQHIQGRMCPPDHVNVSQWYWARCNFRHMELNSRYDVSPSMDQKFIAGFCVIFWFVFWLRLLRTSLKVFLWDLHSLQVGPAWEWIFGLLDLFQTILLLHLRLGTCNVNVHHSSAQLFPLHGVFEHGDYWRVHIFQLFNVCNQSISFPNSLGNNAYPRNMSGKTVLPNGWSLDWSFAETRW